MSDVAVCPRCEGEKKVHNGRSGQMEQCPTCEGAGVVWRDRPQEGAAPADGGENLDLTYRR